MSASRCDENLNMIRVLFLAQLPPPVHGASLMSRYLLDGLLNDPGYQVEAVNISTADSLAGLGKPTVGKLLRLLCLVLEVFSTLLRHRFDVVYITLSPTGSAFFKDGLLLTLAKPFVRRRIIHLHGKGIQAELSRSSLRRLLYRWVFSGCEVVHLSQGLLADIEGLPCASRHVVANGVPAQQMVAHAEKEYDFIYLSNLVEVKGIFVFLEALGQLKAQGAFFRAAVVGAATDEVASEVASLIATYGLRDYVALLGPRYGAEKYAALKASRVFVLPTFYRNECFPLSILEAMSVGLAVVSTDEGAISEIVEHGKCGLIVKRRSSESLGSALLHLLEDPDQVTEMAQTAKDKFCRAYTLDSFISEMNRVLAPPLSESE